MLPPVAPDTLQNNPLFRDLHQHLTTVLLDPVDASTRGLTQTDKTLDHELRTHRAELAKSQLLQKELEALTSRSSDLSEHLQETIDLLRSPTYRNLSDDDDKLLLQDEFEELEDSLPLIGHHLSTSFQKTAMEVARVAYPLESPKGLEQKLDDLPADTAHRLNALQKSRAVLTQKQLAFAALSCDVLDTYHAVTTRLLSLLNLKSTTICKALVSKTEHLALVAESLALKLSVLKHQSLDAIYDPEAINALENYHHHLRDTSTRLAARQRTVEEELRKYQSAGSDMRGLVERYGQIMRSIEAVTKDIRRLGGRV